MLKKYIIRITTAFACIVAAIACTTYLSDQLSSVLVDSSLFAVSSTLFLPMKILTIASIIWLFFPTSRNEEIEDDSYDEDIPDETTEQAEIPEIDASEYPEFVQQPEKPADNPVVDSIVDPAAPDIKKILTEQIKIETTVEIPTASETEKAWEDFIGEPDIKDDFDDSIYKNIPIELPEGYSAENYTYPDDTDEHDEENYDDDLDNEYVARRIHPFIIKSAAFLIILILSVILPVNTSTIYCEEKIITRTPFCQNVYSINDITEYTVGVKLSGDISVKLIMNDGKNEEIIYPDTIRANNAFSKRFTSPYGYAANFDRLLKRSSVKKSFGDLSSLNLSKTMSETDKSYTNEILNK